MLLNREKILGLDISDSALKAVVLEFGPKAPVVKSWQKTLLPAGLIVRGQIKNPGQLAKIWRNFRQKLGAFDKLVLAAPEEQTFFHRFKIADSQGLLAQAAKEAQTNIPIAKEDLLFACIAENRPAPGNFALLAAISRRLLSAYQLFFHNLNGQAIIVTAPFALLRGLWPAWPLQPFCLVDIGGQSTKIIIFSETGLVYEHTISYASGAAFTEKISQVLKIPWPEAENLKKLTEITQYGKNQGAAFVLRVVLESIAQEVKTAIEYCHKTCRLKIRQIVLTGGSSQLKGLLKYYQSYFSVFISKPYRGGEKIICQRGQPHLGPLPPEFVLALGAAGLGAETNSHLLGPQFQLAPKSERPLFGWPGKIKFKAGLNQLWPVFLNFYRRFRLGFYLIAGLVCFWLFFFVWQSFFSPSPKAQPPSIAAPPKAKSQSVNKTKKPAAQEKKQPRPAAKINWIIVKDLAGRHLNVRQGPGLNFPIIGQAEPAMSYPLLAENGEWLKIKLSTTTSGWVFAKLVEKQ